jgi:uroporphyrinogen-III decarboxylase
MSFEHGMAALNLEMPPRIPRTEYSAERHWDLIQVVTGLAVGVDSPPEVQNLATREFVKAWNYDLVWNVCIAARSDLAECRTDMGHAEYAAGGVDRNETIQCPFSEPDDVLAFDPMETYGPRDRAELIRRYERNYREQCEAFPTAVNMTGVYITLMSGLIDIFGWDMLLMGAGTDLEAFGALADRYAAWIQQYFDALAETDVPVVMIHDDIVWTSGPFLSPDWYRAHVFPNYKKLLDPLIQAGKRILYTSDGNYSLFIDDIAGAGVHAFVMEPATDMAAIAERYGKTHAFIGNADTRILLSGTKEAIRAEVERCMAIGKACPGFFLAVGNHIPSNTPVENALHYNRVYEEMMVR